MSWLTWSINLDLLISKLTTEGYQGNILIFIEIYLIFPLILQMRSHFPTIP